MAKRQYRLKVYPAGLGHKVYRNLEICGEDTLDQLCDAVLEAFAFSKEHLYEFCMNNQMYQDDNYQSDPEDGKPSTAAAIGSLGLHKGQNFSLHYDFGDDWMFTIHVMQISETDAYHSPIIIKAKGEIEQYPDYGEEWDEEEWEED